MSAAGGRVDWLGATVVTLGLGGLVSGFIESVSLGWEKSFADGGLIVGCVCLVLFVLVESRVASPMVPLTLFASQQL